MADHCTDCGGFDGRHRDGCDPSKTPSCPLCGARLRLIYGSCLDRPVWLCATIDCACNQWSFALLGLGPFVRRLVRQQRVTELRERVVTAHHLTTDAASAFSMLTDPVRRANAKRNLERGYTDHQVALDALVAMAMEGVEAS